MKRLFISVLLLSSTSCTASPLENSESTLVKKNIGWMHGNCLAIKNQDVNIPTNITLIKLDEKRSIEKAVISSKATNPYECFPLMADRSQINRSNGYSFYLIDSPTAIDLAIGVIGAEKLNTSNFDYCTTTEGIKYFVKNSSTVVWEGYYYLGYDSEVSCK